MCALISNHSLVIADSLNIEEVYKCCMVTECWIMHSVAVPDRTIIEKITLR